MKKDQTVAVVTTTAEKYKAKPTEEVTESIIQEIEGIVVEHTKISRENSMLALWETGEVIRKYEKDNKLSVSALVQRIAIDNRLTGRQMGERNLWFAVKIFDQFPKFVQLYETEHGENITVSKVKKMLTTPKEKKEKTSKELAMDIIKRLGSDKSRTLANEIIKQCDKLDESIG